MHLSAQRPWPGVSLVHPRALPYACAARGQGAASGRRPLVPRDL